MNKEHWWGAGIAVFFVGLAVLFHWADGRYIVVPSPYSHAMTSFIMGNNPELPVEYAERIGKTLVREAVAAGVDPASLAAVAAVESHFWPNAKSKKGALGITQVMPYWLEELSWEHTPERLLYDPETNIRLGARVLKYYQDTCGGLEEGFACYVAGPGNKHIQEAKDYAKKVLGLRSKLCSVEPLFCNSVANSSV